MNEIHLFMWHGQMGAQCWLQRDAAERQKCSSPPFSLTHYPGGSVMAPQSGLLLLQINLKER